MEMTAFISGSSSMVSIYLRDFSSTGNSTCNVLSLPWQGKFRGEYYRAESHSIGKVSNSGRRMRQALIDKKVFILLIFQHCPYCGCFHILFKEDKTNDNHLYIKRPSARARQEFAHSREKGHS